MATACALRQSFQPLIVSAAVSAHPSAPEMADMLLALEQAIAVIEETIEEGTDLLTKFVSQMKDGESGNL